MAERIKTTEAPRPSEYAHSPPHHLVLLNDAAAIARLLATLPALAHPSSVLTASDAARECRAADAISALLDRRDVPGRDTPLHLAVRLDRASLVAALADAGADPSLQNSAGWSPLHEALSLGRRRLAALLLRRHRFLAWHKLRRRLPSIRAAMAVMPDFYMELDLHFESPIVPLLSKAAPSDTYRIWKRGVDARVDTSLAGFDGLRARRADQSFLFLGDPGDLLVLNRGRREVFDAFASAEGAADELSGADAAAHRPGINITNAEVVPRTSWLRKEKVESVGQWKACRVYDLHNVVFSFKTLRATAAGEDTDSFAALEIKEDEEDGGFLVAEIPPAPAPSRRSCYVPSRSDGGEVEVVRRRKSIDVVPMPRVHEKRRSAMGSVKWKEKETVKQLRPTVWLTEEFPLKVEELLPLLDVMANRVRAVRRLRELLTAKLPPGTFPVKVAIPVVPAVRVVLTFTKFAPLHRPVPVPETETFFTPMSSPSRLQEGEGGEGDARHRTSWLSWPKSVTPLQPSDHADLFAVPRGFVWIHTGGGKKRRDKAPTKMKPAGK